MMSTLFLLLLLFPSCFGLDIIGQNCPSSEYKNIRIIWIQYASFYIDEKPNGTVDGVFARIMKESLARCCTRLNYTFEKVEYDPKQHRQAKAIFDTAHGDNNSIFVIFPILSSTNDPSAFTLLQFIPIKVSPGPMVLTSPNSIKDHHIDIFFIFRMWINPVIFLILSASVSAGVMFWVLVCIFLCAL